MAEDDWSHTDKEWRETFEIAKGLGWSCEKTNNHNIRYLKCPDFVCQILVYSTGGGSTENVARGARKKVRACPHRSIESPLAAVSELLVNADRLLTAAEALVTQGQENLRMEEALELADFADALIDEAECELAKVSAQDESGEMSSSVERKLAEAMDKHDRGQKVKTEAAAVFDGAAERLKAAERIVENVLRPEELDLPPEKLVRSVDSGLRRADLDLRKLPQANPTVAAMSERVAQLKTKCDTVRLQLPA
ncbi:hypothetical protein ACIQTZ_12530 [Paenarthrobacter sp. NPDC090520]|uniref:hypothetical protein n=1 Tax=Paenarthrobacter sp. NPDC090520 TaxID=3364382 RepID=UPI003810D79C